MGAIERSPQQAAGYALAVSDQIYCSLSYCDYTVFIHGRGIFGPMLSPRQSHEVETIKVQKFTSTFA